MSRHPLKSIRNPMIPGHSLPSAADPVVQAGAVWQGVDGGRSALRLYSLPALAALALCGSPRVQAVTRTWDGGGNDSNWNTVGNWSNDTKPGALDIAAFAGVFGGGTTLLDLGGDQSVLSLSITTATDFSLNHDTLTLANGDLTRSAASGTTTIHSNLTLGAAGLWNISGNLTVDGVLAGDFALTKSGAGTLILAGPNTYSGLTTVSAGVLNIQHADALGSTVAGTVVTAGEALQIQGGIVTAAEALSLTGTGVATTGALRNISDDNTYSGAITLAGNTRIQSDSGLLVLDVAGGNAITGTNDDLTFGGAGNITVADAIATTAGSLTKDGAGILTLSAANTFTGLTTVAAGTLAYGTSNALSTGAVTVAGGSFDLGSFSDTVGVVTLNDGIIAGTSGVLTGASYAVHSGLISAILGGPGGLNKTTTGTVTLTGANTYSGTTTLSAGTLRATTSASALGAGTLTLAGGILQLADDSGLAFNRNTTVSGNMTVQSDRVSAGAGVTHTLGTLGINSSTLTVTVGGNVSDGTAGLTFGDVTLSASGAVFSPSAGVWLNLAAVSGNARNFTVQGAGTTTIHGVIGTTTGTLTKAGTGTLTLAGANTYTGTTTITGGKLLLTGSLGGTAVTVRGGASLAGTGSIGTLTAGSVTLVAGASDAARGAIDLTDGAPGTLDFNARTTLATVATLGGNAANSSIVKLDLGSTADLIRLGTNARLSIGAGGALVRLTGLGGLDGSTQTLIDATGGGITGAGTFADFTLDATSGDFGGYTVALSTATANQLKLTETANPAPTTAYWKGTNDGVWISFSGGNANTSNFATNPGGTNANGKVGAATDVIFNATTAANFAATSLGEDLTIQSLMFGADTSASVGIGGSHTLTLAPASAATGVTVAAGSGNHTISSRVALGAAQTWTVTDPDQTLYSSNEISGGFALTKAGLGTLALSGINTYSGDTTIKAGIMRLTGAGGLANSMKIIVGDTGSNGAVLDALTKTGGFSIGNGQTVSGIGTIIGLTRPQTGANLDPGNHGPGILTLDKGNLDLPLTLDFQGGSLNLELNGPTPGSDYDQLKVFGSVRLSALASLISVTMGVGYTPVNDTLFFVLVNDGSEPIEGTFSNAPIDGGSYTSPDGQHFLISYSGNSTGHTFTGGNDVVLRAVPEPDAAWLGGIGVVFLLHRRRRRAWDIPEV